MTIHSKTLDTDVLLQVCFITDDLDRTAQWLADLLEVELPPMIPSAPPDVAMAEYLGKPVEVMCYARHFRFANIVIEVIQPDSADSAWKDFLDRRGPSIHHIAFGTRDMARTTERLATKGLDVLQKGEFPGGRYAYFNTEPQLGALLELLEYDRDKR